MKLKVTMRVALGIFLYLLMMVVSSNILYAYRIIADQTVLDFNTLSPFDRSLLGVIYSVLQIIVFALYIRARKRKIHNFVYMDRLGAASFVKLPLYVFAGLLVSVVITNIIAVLSPYISFLERGLQEYQKIFNAETLNPFDPLTLLFVVVFVPVAEELLFRVWIVGEFKNIMKPLTACLLSALIFAVAHWNALQSVYTFFAGFLLAVCYLKYRNFIYNVLIHILFNFLGSTVSYIIEDNYVMNVLYALLLLVGGIAGLYFFVHLLKEGFNDERNLLVEQTGTTTETEPQEVA